MTLDIQFVRDNLSTPSRQLELFKQILKSFNNKQVAFIWLSLSDIRNIDKNIKDEILQLGIQKDITFDIFLFKQDSYFFYRTIEKMLEELSRAILDKCKELDIKSVYITEPEALLQQNYIYCYEVENRIILESLIGIYFG